MNSETGIPGEDKYDWIEQDFLTEIADRAVLPCRRSGGLSVN